MPNQHYKKTSGVTVTENGIVGPSKIPTTKESMRAQKVFNGSSQE